jgi:hypothetical protein
MDDCRRPVHGRVLRSKARIAAALAAILMANIVVAHDRVQFDIAAGNDASLTINEFSRQSSIQVLFNFNEVRGLTTRPVKGDLDPSVALKQMLTGVRIASRNFVTGCLTRDVT